MKEMLKKKKWLISAIVAVIALGMLTGFVFIPQVRLHNKYVSAQELFTQGKFDEAIAVYQSLGDYSDCAEKIQDTKYHKALTLLKNGKFSESEMIFKELGNYKDSSTQAMNSRLENIKSCLQQDKWQQAQGLLSGMEETNEVKDLIKEAYYQQALYLYKKKDYISSSTLLKKDLSYKKSKEYFYGCGKALQKKKNYREAKDIFYELGSYKKSKKLYNKASMSLKYAQYKNIKLLGSEFTFIPKKEAEKYVKKFYGTWYDTSSGDKFKFGKYKRDKKEYGIRAVYVLNTPIIVYYHLSNPDILYAEEIPGNADIDEKYGKYWTVNGYNVNDGEISDEASYTYSSLTKEQYDDVQERYEEEQRRLEEQMRIEEERRAQEQLNNTLIEKTKSAFKERLDGSLYARDEGARIVELGNGVYTVYWTAYVHNLYKDFYGLHGTNYNVEATWQVNGNQYTLVNLRY